MNGIGKKGIFWALFAGAVLTTAVLAAGMTAPICVPGLVVCDEFDRSGTEVDLDRWREPSETLGRSRFRSRAETPEHYRVDVRDGRALISVLNFNPRRKQARPTRDSEPKKTEPAKSETDTKADVDTDPDKMKPETKDSDKTDSDVAPPPGETTIEDKTDAPETKTDETKADETKEDDAPETKTEDTDTDKDYTDEEEFYPTLGTRLVAGAELPALGGADGAAAVSFTARVRFSGNLPGGLVFGLTLRQVGDERIYASDFLFTTINEEGELGLNGLARTSTSDAANMDFTPLSYELVPLDRDVEKFHVIQIIRDATTAHFYVDGRRVARRKVDSLSGRKFQVGLEAWVADVDFSSAFHEEFPIAKDAASARGYHMEVDYARAQAIPVRQLINPVIGRRPIDACVNPDEKEACGQTAAELACQAYGYDQAADWVVAENPRTVYIGTAKKCDGPGCKTLAAVYCYSKMSRPTSAAFWKPTVMDQGQSRRLDWCKTFGKDCGQPVADEYCRAKGYKSARNFQVEEGVKRTLIIGESGGKRACDKWFCDGFRYIGCGM